MRRVVKGISFFLIVSAAAAIPPEVNPEERLKRARHAVRQLGDPEYDTREAASRELQKIGEPAIPELREATTSPDPEVRQRAQWLLVEVMKAAGKSRTTKMQLNPVLAGEFLMGSPANERTRQADELQHRVRITKSFLIGAHEVTQEEFEAVSERNPSWFAPTGGGKAKVLGLDTSKFPVEQVSWFDAVDFCNRLSEKDGYKPYYKLADVKRDGDGSITAAAVTVLAGSGYRLPTEAEWEYACRGWTIVPFHYGRSSTRNSLNAKIIIPGGYGAAETIHLGRTAKVGGYKGNARGLYDMHGNAGEWCGDWYDKDYYENSPEADPPGPDKGTHRAARGGSWLVSDTSCRSAARAMHPPGERSYTIGFRVARTP